MQTMTEEEYTISPETFARRYGSGSKAMEMAIRKELLGGNALFDSLAQAARLVNTLGLQRSPHAAGALIAYDNCRKVLQSHEEEIVYRYGLGKEDYTSTATQLPFLIDLKAVADQPPTQIPTDVSPARLTIDDLRARYKTKNEKRTQLINRAIRTEFVHGSDTLDLCHNLSIMADKFRRKALPPLPYVQSALDEILDISDRLKDEIEDRYQIPEEYN